MTSQPSFVRNSTQGVFPPYRTVVGPGLGIEPLVPQNRTERGISGPSRNSRDSMPA